MRTAHLNCVDINSREVIEAFIFEIQAEKPQIDRIERIKSIAGKE